MRSGVVACGRRWGKTTLGLAAAVDCALDGRRVWWVAPTVLRPSTPGVPSHGDWPYRGNKQTEQERHVGLDFAVVSETAFIDAEV